jgi:hypothetical protein
MDYKKENMDEEKSFEVIQEEETRQFDHPNLVKRGLTEVSAMFDRNGKGYLDPTERALRRMDSTDKGFLGIDKVCVIFESLQAEQERSSQLLEALRVESKKSLNLKKGVIALSVFTLLLALANIATSFAVARLVKDTTVTSGELLDIDTGARIATTSKTAAFQMNSVDEATHSRNRRLTQLLCETMATEDVNGNTSKTCVHQGTIQRNIADSLHFTLTGVDHVLLNCNGNMSKVFGELSLPYGVPGDVDFGGGVIYKVFPTSYSTDLTYRAEQWVYVPETPATMYTDYSPARYCSAFFNMAIYCPEDISMGADCLVMTASQPTPECPVSPVVCGVPPPTVLIN